MHFLFLTNCFTRTIVATFVLQTETPFELKLNVTDTEFVVVEDLASLETNAVILKVSSIGM